MDEFFIAVLEAEIAHQKSMKATTSSTEQSKKYIRQCRPQDALGAYAISISMPFSPAVARSLRIASA